MLDAILSAPVFLIAFLVVISTLVVFHELGHYWAARWCGVKAEVFSLGFGPTLFARRDRLGTEWRVAALPLGGYVKFLGDADASSAPSREELERLRQKMEQEKGAGATRGVFHFQPVWKRAIIVAAGPVANFILAIAIFTFLFSVLGSTVQPPVVGDVMEDTPAAEAGFEPGDRVLAIGGRAVETFEDISTIVMLSAGETLRVTVERDGQQRELLATPGRSEREDPIGGRMTIGYLGLQSTPEQIVQRHGPVEAVAMGAERTWLVIATNARYVGRIITGKESGDMLGGPVRIVTYSGRLAMEPFAGDAGFWMELRAAAVNLIGLAGVLSVGLGLINLLPIPVLDGGHLLYYGFEAASGRPLSERAQAFGFRAGLVLVAGLMLFATWNDVNYLRGFFS
jgi:regulator of sigma E protease